jgi:hypothetical protein
VTLTFDAASWNANSFEVLPYWTLVWSFVRIVWKIKSLERWQRFSKNSNIDLYLWRSIMKRELVRGLAILNICVKFRQMGREIKSLERWQYKIIHTYVHNTYIHTYGQEPISPLGNSFHEGIITANNHRHIYSTLNENVRNLINICITTPLMTRNCQSWFGNSV